MVRAKWEQLLSADDELRAAVPPARRLPLRRRRPAVAPAAATAAPAPDDALPAPPLPPHHNRRVLHHLLAGALAGATAKTVEAPLDRVKIIFQVSNKRFTLRAAARQLVAIAQSEGVAGLWKGNGALVSLPPGSSPLFVCAQPRGQRDACCPAQAR